MIKYKIKDRFKNSKIYNRLVKMKLTKKYFKNKLEFVVRM